MSMLEQITFSPCPTCGALSQELPGGERRYFRIRTLDEVMNDIYDTECAVDISWTWDAGVRFALYPSGNRAAGEYIVENFDTMTLAIESLIRLIVTYHPGSDFAKKYGV